MLNFICADAISILWNFLSHIFLYNSSQHYYYFIFLIYYHKNDQFFIFYFILLKLAFEIIISFYWGNKLLIKINILSEKLRVHK